MNDNEPDVADLPATLREIAAFEMARSNSMTGAERRRNRRVAKLYLESARIFEARGN